MMRKNPIVIVLVALALLAAGSAWAQGIPTATLSGKVFNEGQGLPGVAVSAKSPALQGTRTVYTGASGEYVFANVPPGDYTITYALQGFKAVTKTVRLSASQRQQLDAVLNLASVAAETTVVASAESISQSSTEATTYTGELLSKLPTGRSITSAVILSPGLNQNGPNGVSISGAMSTENLYTINGVVITDNVRSTVLSLFIEDSIQETTTMTAGISAEYGRFTGGVINTITKSGGNSFSGSFRTNFANDAWRSTSAYRVPGTGANPQEGTFMNSVTEVYEATLGGPIIKDMLWFFGAGRYFDTTGATTTLTRYTNIPVPQGSKEKRYEGKLTFSPFPNHTLTGSYTGNDRTDQNFNFDVTADPALYFNPSFPQSVAVINYSGVLTSALSLEAFYSKRKFTYENYGGIKTDIIGGTPVKDTSLGVAMNAPTFCGVCTPETRDNNDLVIKGTYFLDTKSVGSHNISLGYDDFGGQRMSNNYQSGSNFTLYTQTASKVVGSSIYPVFDAGTYVVYWPILQLSQGNDLRTRSAFLNDVWRLNNALSFNIGVRYDKNKAVDQGGNVTSNDSAWSPRLALTYDVKADGQLRVTASYAKYVAALQDTQAGSGATLAGSPAIFYWYYDGAGATPINAGTPPYVSAADAVGQFFNWFKSQGCMPDPTASSCKVPLGGPPSISGVNVQVRESLASPYANEFTLGVSGNVGPRFTYRADVVRRSFGNFYDLKKDMTTGRVASPVNPEQFYDLGLVRTTNDDYTRTYTGLNTQISYRLGERLTIAGNWTYSHLIGNLVGETAGSAVTRGGLHAYPEYFDAAWSAPTGSLGSDTRHRIRLFATYDVPMPKSAGSLNVSVVESYDSGNPYGAAGSVRTGAYVKNPGYLTPPTSVGYYFAGRAQYLTEDLHKTDLALTYSFRIANAVDIYVTPQIYNLFNVQHIIGVNTTVNTNVNSTSLLAFNPFTEQPVECPQGTALAACKAMGANWQKGSLFGQPTGASSYQAPRSFAVAVGVRF